MTFAPFPSSKRFIQWHSDHATPLESRIYSLGRVPDSLASDSDDTDVAVSSESAQGESIDANFDDAKSNT